MCRVLLGAGLRVYTCLGFSQKHESKTVFYLSILYQSFAKLKYRIFGAHLATQLWMPLGFSKPQLPNKFVQWCHLKHSMWLPSFRIANETCHVWQICKRLYTYTCKGSTSPEIWLRIKNKTQETLRTSTHSFQVFNVHGTTPIHLNNALAQARIKLL